MHESYWWIATRREVVLFIQCVVLATYFSVMLVSDPICSDWDENRWNLMLTGRLPYKIVWEHKSQHLLCLLTHRALPQCLSVFVWSDRIKVLFYFIKIRMMRSANHCVPINLNDFNSIVSYSDTMDLQWGLSSTTRFELMLNGFVHPLTFDHLAM